MHILIIRTSAMGDVVLTLPVLAGIRERYPEVEMTLLTRPAFRPFFSSIDGLNIITTDFRNKHKGLLGLVRIYRELHEKYEFDYIVDLHDVIRSKILRFFFRLSGVPSGIINKGRREKKALIKGKIKLQLKHSVNRYCDVFSAAGLPVIPSDIPLIIPTPEAMTRADNMTGIRGILNVGVAPYAKHKLKIWPENNMIRLLELLSGKHKIKYWLFGGSDDLDRIKAFHERVPDSVNIVGNLSLDEELALMSKLDFMIAMDSANMHMASLAGARVFSIWGGTDPLSGFQAWNQPDEYSIRIPVDELTCRPCTTYGKGECRRGDMACMTWLTPEMVFRTIEKQILSGYKR